jgi:hypothetical protein
MASLAPRGAVAARWRRVLLLAALLISVRAQAQTPRRTPATDAEAQAHYQRALSYYNLREYSIAVLEFKEAYALSNEPQLLFNIAQAYRLDKQYEEALHYYGTFLQLRLHTPNRRDVEQFISEMERMRKMEQKLGDEGLPKQRSASSPSDDTLPPGPPPTIEPEPGTTASPAAPTAAPPPTAAPTQPPAGVVAPTTADKAAPRKRLYRRWWVWTAATPAPWVSASG